MSKDALDSVGKQTDTISVELSTRFLEHFSEQLYSSPQKAFEELISNGWDAGASAVDVRVSSDLSAPGATMSVFDNGTSMDADGLRALWKIAFSQKEKQRNAHGRPVIGKFGIGKLATYVLANKLTYFCKASDGIIRRVTMNYGEVNNQKSEEPTLISQLDLEVFEVDLEDLELVVEGLDDGPAILSIIKDGFAQESVEETADEFGGEAIKLERKEADTWTLAILSDLKETGKNLRVGVLKRMLSAALPFGSDMGIYVNSTRLKSNKIDSEVVGTWKIGPELKFSKLKLKAASNGEETPSDPNTEDDADEPEGTEVEVKYGTEPYPYAEIEGIGRITGSVTLFQDKISVGKSELRGSSNGFFVNVLGRVVNQADPSFGEENLSHAAWARFRMTVKADGLNKSLVTNREQFKETHQIRVFRAFLRQCFNLTRQNYDSDPNAGLSDGGDLLVKALGVISLDPLRTIVSETLEKQAPITGLFDESNITDRDSERTKWREKTGDDISKALGEVKYESTDDTDFAKFRISDSAIIVNSKHPFVLEHTKKSEKELIRTFAMINLLTDVYALEQGVAPDSLQSVREYRDRLLRFKARQTRKSGIHIAQLLLSTQNESTKSKWLEAVVSDALSYLGFDVTELGNSGEPEGYADAYVTPTQKNPSSSEKHPPLFRFTFDAKSSSKDKAKTGNLSLDGIKEHKERYEADYALVVAPGFQDGAVTTRCEQQGITPISAADLGKLLKLTASLGAIPLPKFKELFSLHDPKLVSNWVEGLEADLAKSNQLTLTDFLRAIRSLRTRIPDALDASLVSFICREQLGVPQVLDSHVIALARGLEVIVPELVGVDENRIVVNASADRVAKAVEAQLENLRKASEET